MQKSYLQLYTQSKFKEKAMMNGSHNKLTDGSNTTPSVWIFGYGSLIWKVNFPYQHRLVGYVRGYARRFWQGNTDHRGVPGAPGRVATVVESEEEDTWGVAYKVNPSDVPAVMAYLNHREEEGYDTQEVIFHSGQPNDQTLTALAYIATESNPSYLGPTEIEQLAENVVESYGPSGCNIEYVLALAEAMREIAPQVHDSHLFELEARVKDLLRERKLDPSKRRHVCNCSYCKLTQ